MRKDPLIQAAREYAEMHLDVSGNLGKYLVKAVFQDGAQWQINLKRNNMKEETLEEASLRLFPKVIADPYNPFEDLNKEERNIWIEGAKWEQEQDKYKFSEEDMKQFGLYLGDNLKKLKGKTIDEIFEQFKNL